MKLVIVLLTHIDNLPPARNLLLSLTRLDVQVSLITMYSAALPREIKAANNFNIIDLQSKESTNRIQALGKRVLRRKKLRKVIKTITRKEDVIWTITDYDAMETGSLLLNYRHVMQLMELIHDIPIFDEIPVVKAHIEKYARKAEMIIVPEYNRAHIQKAYWQLCETPKVIPNKPKVEEKKYDIKKISSDAAKVFQKIGNRKIVLYQGTFGYERVLEQFIEAVGLLGKEYCMVLMGRDDIEVRKLLDKYPETFFIPFISAPDHLAVTSRAHIGVLSYVNTSNIRHYDPLNALYCAPNKLYEYACFGIPMIGNDIPGLEIPFKLNNIGQCSKLTAEAIAMTIREIEENYDTMSRNCKTFYSSVNIDRIVEEIVRELKEK